MIKRTTCLLLLIFSMSAKSALLQPLSYIHDWISLDLSLGFLHSEAYEYVYDESLNKISQLNWDLHAAPTIGAQLTYDFLQRLQVSVKGWSTFMRGNATMDDFDWLLPDQTGFTHWSHHPDTKLYNANQGEVHLTGWIVKHPWVELGLLGGWKRDNFYFNATGGCFRYENGEDVGCFDSDEKVISYEQIFSAPFIGAAFNMLLNSLEINALFKYSAWVGAKDIDQHFLRDIIFFDSENTFKMYNASVGLGYYVTHHLKLFINGEYNHYPNNISNTTISPDDLSQEIYIPNSAGIENKSFHVSVGIHYRFVGDKFETCCR